MISRKSILAVACCGVLALGVAACGSSSSSSTSGGSSGTANTPLTGAGSTLIAPLMSKWQSDYSSRTGNTVTYGAIGSGGGIEQITAGTVDFGASDAPLTPDQQKAAADVLMIPWALSSTDPVYNINGVSDGLRLDGPTLANIFLGNITNWNAAAIRALNPGVNLPDTKITVVYRSDGSGSTYAFTNYLATISPQFKSKVGVNTSVNFPTGTGARGSAGVAGVVKSTEGALTYVDAAYSIANKFQFALIKNRAGGNATPGVRGVQAALCDLPAKVTALPQLKIVDPPAKCGKRAYPISTFTYVVVPTTSGDKAADLRKFVYWAVTAGQKFGPPLFFVPLPKSVNGFNYREIKKIQAGS